MKFQTSGRIIVRQINVLFVGLRFVDMCALGCCGPSWVAASGVLSVVDVGLLQLRVVVGLGGADIYLLVGSDAVIVVVIIRSFTSEGGLPVNSISSTNLTRGPTSASTAMAWRMSFS
jgi:hypothetical protein